MAAAYRRALLKLSGEALAGERGVGLDYSVIERLAAKYSDRYEVTVATDDLMERTTVASFGASSISAWQLREEIETAGRNLDERLRQLRRR